MEGIIEYTALKSDKLKRKDSFVSLIKEHQAIIHKVTFFYGLDEMDRNDLSQEIMYQAWRSYKKYRGDAKFTTWLYKVAMNTAHSFYRKRNRRIIADESKIRKSGTATPTDAKELLEFILSKLSATEKSLAILIAEGYPQEEIAEIMGIQISNLRVKIHRMRKKLKQYDIKGFIGT